MSKINNFKKFTNFYIIFLFLCNISAKEEGAEGEQCLKNQENNGDCQENTVKVKHRYSRGLSFVTIKKLIYFECI